MTDFNERPTHVIAGLDPAIQGQLAQCMRPLDVRLKAGHDVSFSDAQRC